MTSSRSLEGASAKGSSAEVRAPRVERAELRPGYSISRVIKGGWQLAGGHGDVDADAAVNDMAAFANVGIDTFDCADIYTGVEALIGRFVAADAKQHVGRNRVRIHTKLVPDLDALDTFGPEDVAATVDRSLQRLRVEQLDLVQAFWWDLGRGHPVETLGSLADLQRAGKVRHIGVTNFDIAPIAALVDAGVDVVSAQVQYSLLDARPAGAFADACAARGVQLICYGVLAGGFISERWLGVPDPGFEFVNRSLVKYRLIIDEFGGWSLFQSLLRTLSDIATRHGVTIPAVATRYVLDQRNVAAAIVGARYASHLPATLSTFDVALDAADNAAITAVLARRQGPGGAVYALEGDRNGRHGAIMKYNLGQV